MEFPLVEAVWRRPAPEHLRGARCRRAGDPDPAALRGRRAPGPLRAPPRLRGLPDADLRPRAPGAGRGGTERRDPPAGLLPADLRRAAARRRGLGPLDRWAAGCEGVVPGPAIPGPDLGGGPLV